MYQSGLFDLYESTEAAAGESRHFLDILESYKPAAQKQSTSATQNGYLAKHIFDEPDATFSLPSTIFNAWREAGSADRPVPGDPVSTVLEPATDGEDPEDSDDIQFFNVLNATPESRFSIPVPHLTVSRFCVVIAPLQAQTLPSESGGEPTVCRH